MPVYPSSATLRSGMPLGGIGAGKFEIMPNGLFNAFTIQNNWSNPLVGSEEEGGILGFHLALSWAPADGSKPACGRLLQTVPLAGLPVLKRIAYEGVFPRVTLTYEDRALGLEASLEARGAWTPPQVKDSSLPAAFFTLRVKNPFKTRVRAGFLFVGRNISGEWCVGRKNRVTGSTKDLDLEFTNAAPAGQDPRHGALLFRFEKRGWRWTWLECWNAVTKNFSFNARTFGFAAWEPFLSGVLPNTQKSGAAEGENRELCGAVAAHRILAPGETAEISFVAAWHFPRHTPGHRYTRWFSNAQAAAGYAAKQKRSLTEKGRRLEKLVCSLPFPDWFNDALLTNLSPFVSSTWYVKDGRFAFYEAPVVCPLMGTIDVGFYGSIPLAYFFPELEISQIMQFARAQRADGYIPHDLGRSRLDLPSDGTTFYKWKDLNPKFVLMACRDWLWSGDREFLKRVMPAVKRAIEWSARSDRDGHGLLPHHEGADQTFDLWEFSGMNPYTASIYLASLLAAERMALALCDRVFAAHCRDRFCKARERFESALWNGNFFGKVCQLSQLNGQWYADLLGLGSVADDLKIQRALETAFKKNRGRSAYGMVNAVLSDGRVDSSNDHSRNIWSGMNYAFISLCLMRGFPSGPLLKEAKKIWDNVVWRQKSPWNQPDTIDAKTGRFVFGDSYYRNMAIWSIPIAFAVHDARTRRVLSELKRLGTAS